jgi:opacity protein-like surface antigen
MTRHFAVAFCLLAATVPTADAQIGRAPRGGQVGRGTTPQGWAGGSLALTSGFGIDDGTTNSTWAFGSSTPLRLTLEKGITSSIGIGISAIGGSVPLTYYESSSSAGCGVCDARATIRQALAILHYGGGLGISPVGEIGLGWTGFSDFKPDEGSATIGPSKIDWDFTMSYAYGIAFGPTQSLTIELLQDRVIMMHQRSGLAGSANSNPGYSTWRLGARYRFEK